MSDDQNQNDDNAKDAENKGGSGPDNDAKGGDKGGDGGKQFEPISSQADLDRIVTQRLERERKKFADYDDLKAKAGKWDDHENANKTDAEKEAERIAELERENQELRSATLRAEVAAAKGVPAALLTGTTREDMEKAADALLEFKGKTAGGKPDKNLGREDNGGGGKSSGGDWLREALTKSD